MKDGRGSRCKGERNQIRVPLKFAGRVVRVRPLVAERVGVFNDPALAFVPLARGEGNGATTDADEHRAARLVAVGLAV